MTASRRARQSAILDRYAQRFRALSQQLQGLDYFCKGTVLKRMIKCGRVQCACYRNPAKRHGPYFELTYKANRTTVNVKLTSQSAAIYKAATRQYRRVKQIVNRLESVSRQALQKLAEQAESDAGK